MPAPSTHLRVSGLYRKDYSKPTVTKLSVPSSFEPKATAIVYLAKVTDSEKWGRQAGAEIEITPEMVEAGVAVYVGFMTGSVEQSDILIEGDLVSAIYRSLRARYKDRGNQQSE